jgi:hypothetical protein
LLAALSSLSLSPAAFSVHAAAVSQQMWLRNKHKTAPSLILAISNKATLVAICTVRLTIPQNARSADHDTSVRINSTSQRLSGPLCRYVIALRKTKLALKVKLYVETSSLSLLLPVPEKTTQGEELPQYAILGCKKKLKTFQGFHNISAKRNNFRRFKVSNEIH